MNRREPSGLYVQCDICDSTDTIEKPGQPPIHWTCPNGHDNIWKP